MSFIPRFCLIFLAVAVLCGCGSRKKPSMSGDEPVKLGDLIDFFPEAKLPYTIDEALLSKKNNDSLLISFAVFSQFVPDSVSRGLFGKGVKPKIYPLGRARAGKKETYLLAKAVGATPLAFVVVFDKNNALVTTMQLLRPEKNKAITRTVTIDRNLTITQSATRKNADGSVSEGKDVYELSGESKEFSLILTDPLEDKVTELINPIDTMSRKQKYTADYGSGKMTLVSVRDGRKKGKLAFFIHFEKSNGVCVGELKGDADIKSPTVAEYREPGDPCILRFIFSASSVTLKEVEGCGARRGLRCSFDGVYPRKKESKPKTAKK